MPHRPVQYWSPTSPCVTCGATSNDTHKFTCYNYALVDKDGYPIPRVPIFQTTTESTKMNFVTQEFVRRPITVHGVQVTTDNINDVAKWCKGTIGFESDKPCIHVKVRRPLNRRQTIAFVGDYVLHGSAGFKVYTEDAFERTFIKAYDSADEPQAKLFAKPTDG